MIDRRKFPRFFTEIKAYFPGDSQAYFVDNVSWKGLFIRTEKNFSPERRFLFFELELPEVGKIPVYGYIVHFGTPEEPGLGIEIVEIDKNFTPVWGLYIKALNFLKEAKEEYERIRRQFAEEK